MSDKSTYTQDEVNEIIKRALAQEAGKESFLDHDDLVEIASEAGIGRQALERAMADIALERTRAAVRQNQAEEIAAERRLLLERFGASLLGYAAVNAALFLLCQRTGGTWYVWPLLGSGVALAMQMRHVLFPYQKLERRRRKLAKQRARALRRAEREELKRKILGFMGNPTNTDHARAFENVVQVGVSTLLDIAERKLAQHRQRPRTPKLDE
ncbi:MAG: 2TM domain-containing protein [Polyangia bacterium]|jgi:hypothetical protein